MNKTQWKNMIDLSVFKNQTFLWQFAMQLEHKCCFYSDHNTLSLSFCHKRDTELRQNMTKTFSNSQIQIHSLKMFKGGILNNSTGINEAIAKRC